MSKTETRQGTPACRFPTFVTDEGSWRTAFFKPSLSSSVMVRRMKLVDKGRFQPPPRLKGAAQRVSEVVAAWPGIEARTHWFLGDETQIDGADFYVGQEELGHIHLDGDAHVFHARAVAEALFAARMGHRFPWSRSVVVFPIRATSDVDHALWLFRLRYDRLRDATTEQILQRVRAYPRVA